MAAKELVNDMKLNAEIHPDGTTHILSNLTTVKIKLTDGSQRKRYGRKRNSWAKGHTEKSGWKDARHVKALRGCEL